MNQSLKKFLSIALLFSTAIISAASCDTSSCSTTSGSCPTTACYPNRSQSRYKVRQVSGMRGHTHDIQDDMDSWFGTLSLTPGYHQTFKSKEIASCLFNGDLVDSCGCDRTILIQGSGIDAANRNAKAWLADYFYLPVDFDGAVTFDPQIKNFIFDIDFFLGLDEWWKGAYVRIHGPIVHTRWDLNMCETITDAGEAPHREGYFTHVELPNANLLKSFKAYANGGAPSAFTANDAAGVSRTVTFQPLKCAKMSDCARKETGFADLRMELGWNFWTDEDYHLGVALAVAAPTGNECCPNWLFDAVVGNGKHWELGGVLTGHYVFWRSEDAEKHFGFYMDANITHMFDNGGRRVFDLKNKPNSKYMLAAKFGENPAAFDVRQTAAPNTSASKIFAEEYAPVANLTTVNVDAGSSVQADIVAWFNFTAGNFSWDMGYNFYARGCEDIDCKTDCDPCGNDKPSLADASQANTWALKGDARMYGFTVGAGGGLLDNQAIPLSPTQSAANIHGGNQKNATTLKTTIDNTGHVNESADNPFLASADNTGDGTLTLSIEQGTDGVLMQTSIQPVFLSNSDINYAGTKSFSHGIFTHLNWNFEGGDSWRPYVGVGAMVEFGSTDDCCDTSCDTDCDDCMKCAPSYWGVWVKGGVSFD